MQLPFNPKMNIHLGVFLFPLNKTLKLAFMAFPHKSHSLTLSNILYKKLISEYLNDMIPIHLYPFILFYLN